MVPFRNGNTLQNMHDKDCRHRQHGRGRSLKIGGLLGLVALLAVLSACNPLDSSSPINADPPATVPPTDPPPSLKIQPPPDGHIYHAAYPDFGGWEDEVSTAKVGDYEDLVGKPLMWAMFSNNWWQSEPGIMFPSERVTALTDAGVVPYIRMMPRNEDEELPDPDYSMQAFIDGNFDDDLKAWAQEAKATGIPLMVEFGTEVNGSWFPWNATWNGAGTTDEYGDPAVADGAERFRDAYRGIIDLFKAEGVANITWVFHADAYNDPEDSWNAMGDYYPGDDYIDWIGISVYGPQEPGEGWWTFEDVLTDSWEEIMAISDSGKPIAIMEWGVIDKPDIGNKAQWISDAFSLLGPDGDYPEIAAISYWHENFDETNLRLDSSPEALAAYRAGIASDVFVSEAG